MVSRRFGTSGAVGRDEMNPERLLTLQRSREGAPVSALSSAFKVRHNLDGRGIVNGWRSRLSLRTARRVRVEVLPGAHSVTCSIHSGAAARLKTSLAEVENLEGSPSPTETTKGRAGDGHASGAVTVGIRCARPAAPGAGTEPLRQGRCDAATPRRSFEPGAGFARPACRARDHGGSVTMRP